MSIQTSGSPNSGQHWGALRITGIYLLLGTLWILFSDKVAARLAASETALTTISLYKGWGFIAVTGILLYLLIRNHTAALRRSEHRLLTLINAMPALISYVGQDRRYWFANQAYESWFGHSAQGQDVAEVVGRAAYQKLESYVNRALAGETVTYETEVKLPKVGTRFISATYVPDKDADGTVRGFFSLVQDASERRQAEEELRQWADAFEHCAHGIALGDPASNRIVLCNPAFALLHHARVEDITGMAVLSLFVPADHDLVRQNVARADQIGHSQFEAKMIRRGGSTFPVQMDLVSVHGEDGELLYRVATAQDISDRKKAEQEEAFQARIIQHINDAVIVSDENLFITGWNAAAERIYGWKEEEVLGKKGEDVLQTEFFRTTRAEVIQGLRETGEFSAEVSQVRKDGTRFYVETRTVVIPAMDGKKTGFVSVNRDITERKEAEKELAMQANILTYLNDALVTTDENFILKSWNSAAERIYGWKAEEVIGRQAAEVLQTEFSDATRAELTQRLLEKGEFSAEAMQARKDGTKVHMDVRTIAVRNEDGKLSHVISVNRDITNRKRTEEEVRRLNEKLEERVIERTAQLHAANKELEAFSYSVSHDLRAPLRAISGYTHILMEDYAPVLDEEGKRICNIISSEAQRMGELIDDLLSFSRLSRKELQKAPVDMKALVLAVYNELTTDAQRNQIEFSVGKLPSTVGDPVLFHQVWVNLLSNAIKFSSKKERAVIDVGTKRSEDELVYFVRDNGAGFDLQYVDKLFGVFQRLHSQDEFEGTGVGLAIVQRIVQRHGGRVWAEGEVDKGATFYFALPREKEKA